MNDKYKLFNNPFGTFDVDLESLYGKPMTYKQFIGRYNFNNPSIEDYWERKADIAAKEALEKYSKKEYEKEFGDFKIKLCYL